MKSLKDFNYLLSLDRRYTKTESEIFRKDAKPVRNASPNGWKSLSPGQPA